MAKLTKEQRDDLIITTAMILGAEIEQFPSRLWRFRPCRNAALKTGFSGGYETKAHAADIFLSQQGVFVTQLGEIVSRTHATDS